MNVSAVVVSRMDHPLGEVLDSILPHVEELIVVRGHEGVWERWEAASRAKCDVVFTQDDDAIVDVPAILAAYESGKVTCNMLTPWRKDYPDGIALVGWGAVFDRKMAHMSHYDVLYRDGMFRWENERGVFDPFVAYHIWATENRTEDQINNLTGDQFREQILFDPVFRRECDRVFTGLSDLKLIDVGARHMPWANGDDRMCRRAHDPLHGSYLTEIRRRIYAVRNNGSTQRVLNGA